MIEKPPIGAPCNGCGLCCRIRVCSAGSYALGLVETWGERVDGPCPALEPDGDGFACGLVRRPKHYLSRSRRGVTVLREAMKVVIGAGIGCDEAGDEPDATAMPKIEAVLRRFGERYPRARIEAAARVIMDKE